MSRRNGPGGRRSRAWLARCAIALVAACGTAAVAQPPEPPDEPEPALELPQDDAVAALTAQLHVEQRGLAERLARHADLRTVRGQTLARLGELYRALDAALESGAAEGEPRLLRLMRQVERAEGERDGQLVEERVLLEAIVDGRRRVRALEEQLDLLAGRRREETGPLSGRWDVVLLPLEVRGTFELRQTGALVGGTYQLEGGWSGSLEGTLVQRKLRLVRIDSKLGRMMELEGTLSADGEQLRGSWLNYELAGGDGSVGSWSARRRP